MIDFAKLTAAVDELAEIDADTDAGVDFKEFCDDMLADMSARFGL